MNETMGSRISKYRKAKGMTQEDLAGKMGVSSQAVSKWETDRACPDVNSLPALAQTLGISVEELMQGKTGPGEKAPKELVKLICRAVPLAMGVAVAVLSVLGELDVPSGFGMLGLGVASLAIHQFLE